MLEEREERGRLHEGEIERGGGCVGESEGGEGYGREKGDEGSMRERGREQKALQQHKFL